ncbi:hypothetical protein, partial [Streptococcus merionis]|uniref:hypothetical protein n=1 Tax=Streptococcus merionis TaxID=400065 RepID=UPI0026F334F4
IIVFLIDYGVELFQVINSERVTLMGLYIKSTEDSSGTYTIFGFTPKIIWVYLGFVLIWCGTYYMIMRRRNER